MAKEILRVISVNQKTLFLLKAESLKQTKKENKFVSIGKILEQIISDFYEEKKK